MKGYFVTVIGLITSAFCTAQKNYINYHKEVIKAEVLLMQTKMKDCLKHYKQTFEEYPKSFARDAFVAFQIACMVEDTNYISYFFEKSVSNGITWEPIKYSEFYKSFSSNKLAYQKRLEVLYDISREKYEKAIDRNIREYILQLLANDDKHRQVDNDSVKTITWLKIMDGNGKKLDSLIQKIGYPGEHIAGIYNSEVVLVRGSKDYPTGIQLHSVPSRIFYHNSCTFQSVKEELLNALKNGELTPKEYALIHEWSYDVLMRKNRWWDKYYKYDCSIPLSKEKQFNFFLNPFGYSKDTAFVNQCRADIGMCSIAHEKKLKEFAKENKLFVRFGFNGSF